jgi:redox-sensitive bicupin YhaK (pirin superfamily)
MSNKVIHKADSRGFADHGWLKSYHSFSFAGYHNPERMHFGVLRVLNDDTVSGGMGFGKHPHDNMEIISIPLEGDLEHKDSIGNSTIIRNGDIQVMSAGTGVQHSEVNKNINETVKFLQIWIFPNKRNVQPRYDQITMKLSDRKNKLQQVLSPNPEDAGVWIHQNAWFHIGNFEKDMNASYDVKKQGNGIYAFVLKGGFIVDGETLSTRDAIGIWDKLGIEIASTADDSEILLMDIPMSFN